MYNKNTITMNKTITLIIGITVGILITNYYHAIKEDKVKYYSDAPVMMWNDDWESIPVAGELVEVEEVTMDTIYFGPVGE